MAYLYRHIRFDKNEPFYIGIGSDSSYSRAYDKKSRNKHWKNIVKSTPYEVDIVLDELTWEEACKKEKEFISLYGRSDMKAGTLCNLTEGGEGVVGMRHTEETKKKISEDNKRPDKMDVCMKNLKKMQTPEARAKAHASRDYKEISRKRVLKTDYNKIREASEKPVLQYDLDGVYIREWRSATEASKSLNITGANICSCCKGVRNMVGGFIWKYKSDGTFEKIEPVQPRNKPIIQYDKSMNIIAEYESIAQASRITGVFKANITACCNYKAKQASGYIWRFKIEVNHN